MHVSGFSQWACMWREPCEHGIAVALSLAPISRVNKQESRQTSHGHFEFQALGNLDLSLDLVINC